MREKDKLIMAMCDYRTKEFLLKEYETANSQNTQDFLNYLQAQRPGQRIAIFWDRASYHRSAEFKEYLTTVNGELDPDKWSIVCHFFAPHAPEQNPVEDIWLLAKNLIRKFYHLCASFNLVKWLFKFFANGQVFDFPKLYKYAIFTQPI